MSIRLKQSKNVSRDAAPLSESLFADPHRAVYPKSWYLFGHESELKNGPVSKHIAGQDLVAFLTNSGQVGVLQNRCVHMGSDLGNGCVIGETVQCALHHWQFGVDGVCTQIPASQTIPSFAKQASYPAERRLGNVYFFNAPQPRFPLPFFDGLEPDDLICARPFIENVDCPWYMIGANAVDVQHFSIAHDRQMKALPTVDHPHPFVHHTTCTFQVQGNSIGDRITRSFGGREVTLQISDWSSTMLFVRSTLAKTESFGMVSVVPVAPTRTMAHVTVMAHRSAGPLQRWLLDPSRAGIRRRLIRNFLRSDVHRLAKTAFSPHTLIEIDQQFSEYFDWLAELMAE